MDKVLKTSPDGIVRKVAWTHPQNKAILFARSHGQTLFYTLGGKVDPGETSREALCREAAEEANITLIPETIKLVHVFEGPCHGYVEGTKLHMECYSADFSGAPTQGREIEELAWFTTADKHRTTPMGVEILDWFAAQNYID